MIYKKITSKSGIYSAFTETGATQTMKANQVQNQNNTFLHFQIQPIKWPVQNNEM